MIRLQLLAAVAVLLAGCASADRAGERLQSRLELAEAMAGAPVDSIRFHRLRNWEPLSEERLIIWTRNTEAWLLDVWGPCSELPWAQAIAIPTTSRQIHARLDSVHVRDQRCRISRIRPLDAAALRDGGDMREVQAAQDEAGGT